MSQVGLLQEEHGCWKSDVIELTKHPTFAFRISERSDPNLAIFVQDVFFSFGFVFHVDRVFFAPRIEDDVNVFFALVCFLQFQLLGLIRNEGHLFTNYRKIVTFIAHSRNVCLYRTVPNTNLGRAGYVYL